MIGEDGKPVDYRTFLLPISDYTIEDVWDTVGLRGTGSNDIVVDDVFVPEHRTLSFQRTSKCDCPGQELNDGPLYRMPYGTIHPFAVGCAASTACTTSRPVTPGIGCVPDG